MRIFAVAAIIALLVAPAYAQKGMSTAREDAAKADQEKKKQAKELEKSYNDAVKRIPDPATQKVDPWANMR